MRFAETGLWADVRGLRAAVGDTVAAREGVAAAARLLGGAGVERIVATGNGAAFYVAQALWLASLESGPGGPPVVAVPCGVAAREGFGWRPGDALLAVSSSGEFRDVVEIARRPGAPPCAAITASPGSSLARAASAVVVQHVASQCAVTHTQAVAGAYACGLAVWAAVTGDAELEALVAAAPDAAAAAVPAAEAWAEAVMTQVAGAAAAPSDEAVKGGGERPALPAAAVAMGGGPRWAAALELALMLKEISRVPAEGVETREGATSASFGLAPGHLALSLDPEGDPAGDEARRLCAATGASVLGLPVAPGEDARLAPITTLPAAAALSAGLALAAGHDVDEPAWTAAYYATAR